MLQSFLLITLQGSPLRNYIFAQPQINRMTTNGKEEAVQFKLVIIQLEKGH